MDRDDATGPMWALLAIVVAVVIAGMLAPYRNGPAVPLGADTPHHIWRMRLVTDQGLDALPRYRGSHLLNANGDRPGLPILAALTSASGGPTGAGLAFVLPAVAAVIAAAGAAALARIGTREPPIATLLYALAVGASVPVAFAANGPFEELLAVSLLIGAVAAAVSASDGARGAAVIAALSLAGAWACHWMVTATATAAMGVAVACWALVPLGGSAERSARRRSARRLLPVLTGACTLAVLVTVLAPALPQRPLGLSSDEIADNLARQAPAYVVSLLVPLAAVGAVSLARRIPPPRGALILLSGWVAIPVAGAVATLVVDSVPLHRLLSLCLAVPAFAAAGAIAVGRLVRGRSPGPGRRLVAAGVSTALVGALAIQAWSVWASRPPSTSDTVASQLAAVSAALTGVDRPVVLVVWDAAGLGSGAAGDFGTVRALRRIRAAMPAALIARTVVYLGDADELHAGRPTRSSTDPAFDAVSLDAWRAVKPVLVDDPIVMVYAPWADTFAEEARQHTDWQATPWLLSSEPGLSLEASPPPLAPPPVPRLLLWAIAIVAALVMTGLGWSLRLGGQGTLAAVALAPGLGAALLAMVGLLADALGMAVGRGGWILVGVVAGSGWVAAALGPATQLRGRQVSRGRMWSAIARSR